MSEGSTPRRLDVAESGSVLLAATRRPGAEAPCCNRCGFPVSRKPWGCKNPCDNCGTVYPLGDCSD